MRRYLKNYLAIVLVFALSSCQAQEFNKESTLLIEPETGRAPILEAISQAQHHIELSMYMFTDHSLATALKSAAQRGIQVQVLLEKQPYEEAGVNSSIHRELNNSGIQLKDIMLGDHALLHQKTLLIDDKAALIMTGNFVYSSFRQRSHSERNLIVIDHDKNDLQQLATMFDYDWRNTLPSNIPPGQLIFSPVDSRAKITTLVQQAKKSLQVYAPSLSDYRFLGALAKAAHQGVQVDILINDNSIKPKAAQYLQRSGVHLHTAREPKIHAKMIIADQRQVYIGSINFTQASFDQNREAGIITSNDNIVREAEKIFMTDVH